jgi:CRISPR system Cascade subunit CasA
MTYDLRTESWIPFRRLSGAVEWGPTDLLVDALDTDPVVALAAPRADFDGALVEFLIGLLAVAYLLNDEKEWRELWTNPPSRAAFAAKLASLPAAFDLDGDGPRFLQDLSAEDLAGEPVAPVQEILIGGKSNRLVFKPGTVTQMGFPSAAMALITIQTYSPAGGRGHRTSMRGGGPLTTLVDPRPAGPRGPMERSLWRYLWANVPLLSDLPGAQAIERDRTPASDTFPWMGPTRTSEGDRATTITEVDPLQAFFGMPRRIRLEFSDGGGTCGLTGRTEGRLVTGFRVKSYGVQYQGWRHPLSPYYAGKMPNEWLPVHGQSGGVGWRDWYSLLYSAERKLAAQVVTRFNQYRADRVGCTRYALRAFGFDVLQEKARAWVDARLPAFGAQDEPQLNRIHDLATSLASATDVAAFWLQRSVVAALYGPSEKPSGDLSHIKSALWSAMEEPFYEAVFRALDEETPLEEMRTVFHRRLLSAAESTFDSNVMADASHPEQLRRAVIARFDLTSTLRGLGSQGAKLFEALQLAPPDVQRARTTRTGGPAEIR